MHANATFKIYDDNDDISTDVSSECRAVMIIQISENLDAASKIQFAGSSRDFPRP